MINDNVLGDRLNAHLNKPAETQTQADTTKDSNIKRQSALQLLADSFDAIWSLLSIFVTAFVLGFAIRTISGTGWTFIEYMIIGVAVNTVMTYVHNLIHGMPKIKINSIK